MLIKVKTLTGKELQVAIEPHNTVKQIKEKIEEQEGIPPTQQRLIFNGKQMQPDDKKAQDLNVTEGSTVHMVLALRGGGSSIVSQKEEEESKR